ncbi:DUF413 domain-containing protein [Thauera sp.]|uniref:DUF413 domain-containing protein n=1 Tax=Thauera sp. TaxID=1905334 RepID=UPI00257BD4AB|nr:DUF413 domain-containing protein [Thauera sp.]
MHDKNWDLIKLTYNRPQKIANRIMDNIPNDQFELQHLKHTKLALSASERNRLLRYGSWASALESGAIKPKNEKQVAFVSMCHGKREPHSDFEFLWLRYRTACETDKTIDDLQKKLDKAINKAEQAKEKLDQLSLLQKARFAGDFLQREAKAEGAGGHFWHDEVLTQTP